MSLTYKVVLIVIGVFVLSAVTDFTIQRLAILPSFLALEQEEAGKNAERFVEAISRELQLLSPSVSDWTNWDDTYRYAQDRNPVYAEENLMLEALSGLKVNLLNIYDTAGELVAGLSVDLESGEPLTLEALAAPSLPLDHPLLRLPHLSREVSGLMATAHGPMLVVAKPILKSDRTGPTTGSLVMGRLLDQAAIQRVAAQAKLQVSVSQAETGLQAAEARTDGRSGLRYTPIHLHEQPDVLQASTTLLDLFGKPILSIAVDTPRAISGRGQAAVGWALASIAAAGLTVMGVLLWLLYRTVLQPVARLTEHAVRVGEKGDLRYRLALDRNDEVGVLAREFDRMTERLGETRRQLIDQSYRSGIAEMASGVLHNIGNAITPLTVRVSNLQEELGQAPLAEMGRAMAELDDPTVPAERREDLLRFVGLAGGELAEAVKSTRSQLTAFSHQLGRIQQILADQERFSRSARVVEPIDLAELVADSAEMLGPDMRAAMTVEIDESVRGIGDVLTARAALQQVIVNLLVNAAESILQAGRDNGRLVVRAEPQIGAGMPMAHVRFEDNGGGIAPEHLKRIFERGFSTKKIASGQGLHWSANTVASLQGELYAESMGIGRGAVLHLKIPFALETPVRAMAVGV